ncbi:hypothetical protein PG985_014754 [Apiospora marii]|uniref:uncharacterized protein n=1 Tax=Apiospora marii TaxID=335849 RepID=UPI00312EA00B
MPEQIGGPTYSHTMTMDHYTTITTDGYTSPPFVSSSSTLDFTITHQERGMWNEADDAYSDYSEDLVVDGGKDPGTLQDFGVTTEFRKAVLTATLPWSIPVDASVMLGHFRVDTALLDETFPPSPLPAVLVRLWTKLDDREKLTDYIRDFKDWMEWNTDPVEKSPKTALLIVAQPDDFDEDVVIEGKRVKKVQGRFTKLSFPPRPPAGMSTPGNRWTGITLPLVKTGALETGAQSRKVQGVEDKSRKP